MSDNECFTNEADVNDYAEGVIGHMEDTDGSNVVDLVFDSSKIGKKRRFCICSRYFCMLDINTGKTFPIDPYIEFLFLPDSHSSQRKKFICEICSRSYTQQLRYMSHKMSHHNVQYECIQCLEKFTSRKLMYELFIRFFFIHFHRILSDLNIRKLHNILVKE